MKEGRALLRDVKHGKVELEGWKYEDVREEMRSKAESMLTDIDDSAIPEYRLLLQSVRELHSMDTA